jgi:hypothetical protein
MLDHLDERPEVTLAQLNSQGLAMGLRDGLDPSSP